MIITAFLSLTVFAKNIYHRYPMINVSQRLSHEQTKMYMKAKGNANACGKVSKDLDK